jgi:hypothetical protein
LLKIIGEYIAEILKCKYMQVHVLLLQWGDDELGVDDELSQLEDVFYNKYYFEVETFEIPSEYLYDNLEWCIADFKGKYSNQTKTRGPACWRSGQTSTSRAVGTTKSERCCPGCPRFWRGHRRGLRGVQWCGAEGSTILPKGANIQND